VNGTYLGTRWTNVFWIRRDGSSDIGVGDLAALCTAVGTKYGTRFMPLVNNASAMSNVSALFWDVHGDAIGATSTVTTVGSLAGTKVIASVAACITWPLQQRYRGGHPRTYLGGLDGTSYSGVTDFTSTFQSSLAAAANSFISDVNGLSVTNFGALHLGVVTFVLRNQWRTPPLFRDFVPGGAIVDSRLDSQRRRLGPDR
jgi:hypothetical protein